jgi:hypothetical protein
MVVKDDAGFTTFALPGQLNGADELVLRIQGNQTVTLPESVAGGGGTGVFGEVPTPAPNGTITTFLVSQAFVAATLCVYLNGLRQRPTTDFTIVDSTHFALTSAPMSGDSLLIDYQH